MIELRQVRKSYQIGSRQLEVLKGLDLQIGAGELVSVMGPSGSGKSTLLNILGLLDFHDSGDYLLDGQKIGRLNETQAARLRNKYLGFIFQSFHLLSFKNAMENVALPLYYRGLNRSKRNRLAMEYLDKVGLADWATHLPSEMSGGQNQRIAIARALITEPKLILADEPTGALDSKTSEDIMQLFREVNKSGITVLVVTHDADMAQKTDRLIRIKDGLIDEK